MTVDFSCKTSSNNNNNNKNFLCPSVNLSGRESGLDTYMLLAFGSKPKEVSVSEPFRSSNLQQWQIKDHEGNRLQVPVRAGFILSQHSGKRHLLTSVNLMARQMRKTEKNCHKFFPFPSNPHPGSEWLHKGLLASSRRESSVGACACPGVAGQIWGHPAGRVSGSVGE